jgi:signal transduction histidine kinase
MANPPPANPAELNAATLREKYVELCQKYASLVERQERYSTRHSAVFQLGSWGLRMRGAALALVAGGRIEVSNGRFNQFARVEGKWRLDGTSHHGYPALRELILVEAGHALERDQDRGGRLRNDEQSRVLSLHIECSHRGRQSLAMVMLEDVTEQAMREEELNHTREALMQRERIRVLGLLAAGVAHDLGSTLRGAVFQLASLNPGTLRDRNGAVSGAMERLEIASQIVGRLHDFARDGANPTVGPVRLSRVLQRAVAAADLEAADDTRVRVVSSFSELPEVSGNEAELSLMFVNLLRNAREAMPEGGTVRVTARHTAGAVRVTVADEGDGIPELNLTHVFTPFFTTKGPGGTGLGLWLAKGTMSRIGGSIQAGNRAGGGAIFTVEFPLVNPSEAGRRRGSAARAAPAARKRRRAPRSGRQT